MDSTSGGAPVSLAADRRRSSPSKTKGRGGREAMMTSVGPTSADLHRSHSHEPRRTPPLFLIPPPADRRSVPVPVLEGDTLDTTDRPSSSSARLLDSGKPTSGDDKGTDDADRRSTSSGGRDTVVQLNCGGSVTEVVVDGGKSISDGSGEGDDPAAGKTSPVDGCEAGIAGGGGQDGDGERRPCWRMPLDALANCHAAWLSGVELAQEFIHGLLTTHLRLIKRVLLVLVLVGFAAYLIAAVWKSGLCAIAVIVITLLGVLIQTLRLLKRFCAQRIDTIIAPVSHVRHGKPCLYLKR